MLRPVWVFARIVSVKRTIGSFLTVTLRRSALPLTVRLYRPLTKIRARVTFTPPGARKRTLILRFVRQLLAFDAPPRSCTKSDPSGAILTPVGARPDEPSAPAEAESPDAERHEPSGLVSFSTWSLCVAYRQPSEPTVTKSPREPPVIRSR